MSNIGGEIGGKIGNRQNPFFTSSGGVTTQQKALADLDYGQSLLADEGQFESPNQPGGGIMDSTMVTQAAGGANTGRALNLAELSAANQDAQFRANQVANAVQATNQQGALTSISQLDKLAGSVAGATAPTGTG